MSEKIRPEFLNPDIKVGPLKGDEYGGGSFTRVGNLENHPESIKEKVPEGYVVKEYKPLEYEKGNKLWGFTGWEHFFAPGSKEYKFVLEHQDTLQFFFGKKPSDAEISKYTKSSLNYSREQENKVREDLLKKTSVQGVAKELQNRNSLMVNYFSKSLPELVVPTQVIIGSDSENRRRIYEIQPRINYLEPMSGKQLEWLKFRTYYYNNDDLLKSESIKADAEETLENFIARLKEKFPEKLELFKKELKLFVKEIREFPDKEKYLPFDSAMLINLVFTKQGLRLIDTNFVLPRTDEVEAKYRRVFDNSLKLLELIESKL